MDNGTDVILSLIITGAVLSISVAALGWMILTSDIPRSWLYAGLVLGAVAGHFLTHYIKVSDLFMGALTLSRHVMGAVVGMWVAGKIYRWMKR